MDLFLSCKDKILSEDYGAVLLDFTNPFASPEESERYCFTRVNDRFGIAYAPVSEFENLTGPLYLYHYLPKVFGLMQEVFDPLSLMSAGILQTQRPPLSLTGSGVVLAFVDTGIRYAREEFRNAAGNSRVLAVWDQTLQTGAPPEGYQYGTLFTREELNQALRTDDPYSVAATYDEDGHGTALASVAAGSVVDGGRTFRGAAPDAEIVVVKLRQAKRRLRDYYLIPENVPAYAETDIMLGVKFAESFAVTFQRPVVICIGLGSNMGGHEEGSLLAQFLDDLGKIRNRGIVICAGNEGNAAHHFSAPVSQGGFGGEAPYTDVEIRVGEGERGFLLEMWSSAPDVLEPSVRTPGGETVPRFRVGLGQSRTYTFVYERTRLTIESILVEPGSGDELVVFRFEAPTPGVWTIRVYTAQTGGRGEFHMWLPITQFLNSETYFLAPNPYTTITDPGVAASPITTSAFDDTNNSFYANSGRGFLRNGTVKPNLAAPGVNVSTALGRRSGTSLSAAMTAGGMAQFFQWAVVERHSPLAENREIKSYFIRGATRGPDLPYPNREWGYGRLNVEGVFEAIAGV